VHQAEGALFRGIDADYAVRLLAKEIHGTLQSDIPTRGKLLLQGRLKRNCLFRQSSRACRPDPLAQTSVFLGPRNRTTSRFMGRLLVAGCSLFSTPHTQPNRPKRRTTVPLTDVPPALRPFIELDEVLALVRVSSRTLRTWMSLGRFPRPLPIGRRRQFWSRSEVMRALGREE
jgi:predicted DNA-binding transcriptional regulator AlpA